MNQEDKKYDTQRQKVFRETFEKVKAIIRDPDGARAIEKLDDLFASGAPSNGYITDTDGRNVSYLDVAREEGNFDALAYLIVVNYDTLCKDGFWFDYDMRYQAVLETLIDVGHSFEGAVERNRSEFWLGVNSLDEEYLPKLRELGANFDHVVDVDGVQMPLVCKRATFENLAVFTEKLLAAGANPDARSTGGLSVLHGAVTQGKPRRAKELDAERSADRFDRILQAVIAAGGNVDMADEGGQTALHVASKLGYFNKARMLVEAGANVRIQDKNGKTPEDLARAAKRADVLQMFASIRARNAILEVAQKVASAAGTPSKP